MKRPAAAMGGDPEEVVGGDESKGSGRHRGAIAETVGGERKGRRRKEERGVTRSRAVAYAFISYRAGEGRRSARSAPRLDFGE